MDQNEQQGSGIEELYANSVIGRFSKMTPQEFERLIDQKWAVVKTVTDTLKESVRSEAISPLEAVKISACAAGTVFGYDEFHPHSQGNPYTLALTASLVGQQAQSWSGDRSQSRDQQPVGVR